MPPAEHTLVSARLGGGMDVEEDGGRFVAEEADRVAVVQQAENTVDLSLHQARSGLHE